MFLFWQTYIKNKINIVIHKELNLPVPVDGGADVGGPVA